MDATVIVAIAGLLGTSSGAILSYRAGVASAREETERLREQHREEERRNRQGTYHQLVALVNEMMWATRERYLELHERWFFVGAGVTLFGGPMVAAQLRPLSKLLAEGAESPSEEWRERVILAGRELISAMREDIGLSPLMPVDHD